MGRSYALFEILAALVLLVVFYYSFASSGRKWLEVDMDMVTCTNFCKIPEIPMKPAALSLVPEIKIKPCENTPRTNFTHLLDKGTLILLPSDEYNSDNCCVHEISRPYDFPSDTFQSKPPLNDTEPCITFTDKNQLNLEFEFLVVKCVNLKTKKIAFNYHTQVNPAANIALAKKLEYWNRQRRDQEPLPVSVMLFVLDSTSRADALRSLPNTMHFLLNSLNFTEFLKFHNTGEATMKNVVPLLMGMQTNTFSQRKAWDEAWDKAPFIWKNFEQSNYVTAFTEDIPEIGTFNYGGQVGFRYPPTSLYIKPFFSAFVATTGQQKLRHSYTRQICLGPKQIYKVLLDYQLEILRKLSNRVPTFTIPWFCWPFHDFYNTLSAIEDDTLNFFKEIAKSKEILENTVLIVMGDHGFHGGPYAQSHEGLLERRLPLFLIRLPEMLQKRYPNFQTILKQRSEEVISHYDVYKTLLQISKLKLENYSEIESALSQGLGVSLFAPVRKGRCCSDAGTPHEYCACGLPPAPLSPPAFYSSIPVEVRLAHG